MRRWPPLMAWSGWSPHCMLQMPRRWQPVRPRSSSAAQRGAAPAVRRLRSQFPCGTGTVKSMLGIHPNGSSGMVRWSGSPPSMLKWWRPSTVRIYCSGNAAVDNRRIWTARSGTLKVVLQMHSCLLESRAADPSKDLVFSSWPKPMMATPWRRFLIEGVIEVKLPTPPAIFRGNPRAVDQMTAAPLCRSLLGASFLKVCIGLRDQWTAPAVERRSM